MADIIDAAAQPLAAARTGFPRFRYVVVGLMFLGSVILWADRLNISVAAPLIVKDYGWSPTVLGAIFSSFTFGYLITQIPGGRLGDAMPRRILGWTGVLWSLFTALTPLGRTPLIMGSIRFILGISEGPFLPTTVAVLARWVPRTERASINGLVTSASNWAPVVFPCRSRHILVHSYGWPSTFYVFAAIGIRVGNRVASRRAGPARRSSTVGGQRRSLAQILDGRGIGAERLPLGPDSQACGDVGHDPRLGPAFRSPTT